MSKNIIEFIENKIEEKYHNSSDVIKMITDGDTPLLNPAYNTEYRQFLQKFIDGNTKEVDVLLESNTKSASKVLENEYGYSPEEASSLARGDISVSEDNHTFYMAGIGGVGANILHMLQNVSFKSEHTSDWKFEAVEFDNIELSNIFRFPFKIKSLDKKDNANKLNIASTSSAGTNVNIPVLYDAMELPDINITPMGAMDTETRLTLNEMRTPSIIITHSHDSVKVEVSPSQSENQDIVFESYGKIDINFLLPALHMVSKLVFQMLDKEHPIVKKITEFKMLKHIQIRTMLGTSMSIYHSNVLKKLKYRASKNIEWECEDEFFEKIQLETTKLFYKYYSNKQYHELLNNEMIPEGTKLFGSEVLDDSHKFEMNLPIYDKVEEMWEEISEHTILEIKEEDVFKFLDMKTDEELDEYIRSKTNLYE